MKVLHIISGGDSGGAKTHLFHLLDRLTKKAEVTVACLMKGVFYQEILERDVRTVLFEQKNRFDLSVCRDILQLIESEQMDIIHCHGARANFVVAALMKRTKVPVITTMHSDYELDFDVFYKKVVFTTLNKMALKKFRYFAAVSDAFQDMLISRGFSPNGIYTIYNGLDFSEPVSLMEPEKFAEKYGVSFEPGKWRIGIAARMDKVKGVEIFVRAAAKILALRTDVSFYIAGDGEEENNLKQLANDLGIGEQIHFLGFVPDIYSFYHFLDINLLTSYSESFPYALLEGAKLKKATVSAAVGGIPALILDGETGFLFEKGNSSECAEKIERFLNEPELIETLGNRLYDYASAHFSDEALAERHMEIYQSILEKEKKTSRYDMVLTGYYGYENSGDDALLSALLYGLKKHDPNLDVLILSAKPKETKRIFKVDARNRFSPSGIWYGLCNSKMLVNGGGDLIQDVTSTKSLWYYLAIIRLAKRMHKKVAMLANGVQSLQKKANEKRAVRVLGDVDLITLRDRNSLDYLKQMNLGDQCTLTADLAFLLEPEKGRTYHRIREKYHIPEDYFVIAVRDWKTMPPKFPEDMARALTKIRNQWNIVPVFLAMQYKMDEGITEKITSYMDGEAIMVREPMEVGTVMDLISDSKMVVGMRLHSLIFGAGCNVPSVGLVYDKKVQSFLEDMESDAYIDISDWKEETLYRYMNTVMESREAVREKQALLSERMKTAADRNITMALDLLNK